MRRAIVLPGVLLATALVAAAVPGVRHSTLRWAGWVLVANDPLTTADVIVISADARAAGVLEAVDLVHTGISPRVALFRLPSNPVGRELARRGVDAPDPTAISQALLEKLGIGRVELIPWPVVGTEDEGRILRRWCAAQSIRSIVFVSTADHSRRTRRVLDRDLGPDGVRVSVRYSRYSDFDPDRWWQSRDGQRTQIVESQKLLFDLLLHPLG